MSRAYRFGTAILLANDSNSCATSSLLFGGWRFWGMPAILSPCGTCVRLRSRRGHPALRWSRCKSGAWRILPPVSRRLRRARICSVPEHGPTEFTSVSFSAWSVGGAPRRFAAVLMFASDWTHSPNEHQESWLLAHDGDVPLAGRGVLQSKHAAGRKPPRLTVGRGDGKDTLQDDTELRCGRRMVEAVFQVPSAPARVESSEERARRRKVATDVDWRRRRREVRLAEIDRHILKVRISVGCAIEPCIGEMRRIAALLASRCDRPRQDDETENNGQRSSLPAHR